MVFWVCVINSRCFEELFVASNGHKDVLKLNGVVSSFFFPNGLPQWVSHVHGTF